MDGKRWERISCGRGGEDGGALAGEVLDHLDDGSVIDVIRSERG